MNLHLNDRVAIITGASRGIGRATAQILAAEGMRLVLAARDADDLRQVAASCPTDTLCVAIDLCAADAAQNLIARAIRQFGAIDLLVNNAGATKSGDFLQLSDNDWQDGFALKLFSAVRCSRAAWPHLQASAGGLINIAGVGGRTGRADTTIGGAVNAAMLNLTKSLADRGVQDGVRVNAINPSSIVTDRLQSYIEQLAAQSAVTPAAMAAQLAGKLGAARLGEPEEVARAVAFLASPASGYCQGAILDVDGGQTRTL